MQLLYVGQAIESHAATHRYRNQTGKIEGVTQRIVVWSEIERRWLAKEHQDSSPLFVFLTKKEAVSRSVEQLRGLPGGGTLLIYKRDGVLGESRTVPGKPTVSVNSEKIDEVHTEEKSDSFSEQIEKEGNIWNDILAIVLPLAASGGSAMVSNEVASAQDWLSVFFATLAWSLGCCFSVLILKSNHFENDFQKGWAIAASFGASLLAASILGVGAMDITHWYSQTGGYPAVRFLLAVLFTAFSTFGWFGALMGGGIGVWLGYRIARLVK